MVEEGVEESGEQAPYCYQVRPRCLYRYGGDAQVDSVEFAAAGEAVFQEAERELR
jgi:hypothetical protein